MPAYQRRAPATVLADAGRITSQEAAAATLWASLCEGRRQPVAAAVDAAHGTGSAAWLLDYLQGSWTPDAIAKQRRSGGVPTSAKTIRSALSKAIKTLAGERSAHQERIDHAPAV
jgi:hypothetical protein